ncbi:MULTISPECIES: prepilin-type N-terminal cleavage/methylation domain-containing protein [Clostridium]|uniref:prepilin-type N-terminal cleavage/methylation domain-containing protein n=1 Tax=Clostridium TaxID=1485 RepID=UPI00082704C2|nr:MULTISPECIES: type II secretion system protein [Clostridium]PJI09921.1 type II secretion system protein [Clostridium sp. CT7]
MLKLRSKKGFALVEVMCAFSIFSILFLFAIDLKVDELKMKKFNDEVMNYTYYLDAVKNEIIFNYNNSDIEGLKQKGKICLSKSDIQSNNYTPDLKNIGTCNLNSYPYIIVNDSNVGGRTNVNLKLYTKILGKEKTFVCTFVK